MASLVNGFEYDIFISYRHNDNRSGWVTEFVQHLNEELAATIKEPVSVYFDSNPHDGLLEMHNVDKSLEGKLKCLVFIPILSQTYCDAKSFAWEHEFCAFNALAKQDQLGIDIKLKTGNVISRVLPIKIHDLDEDDIATIEREMGGFLRAIEFIYKEPGVNRPLKPSDSRNENQNKTDYLNQINKIANALKEIINSVHGSNNAPPKTRVAAPPTLPTNKQRGIFVAGSILILILASIFLYLKIDLHSKSLEKSIAVLAFVDMSPTHDQEYLGDGISEEIINVLAQTEGLKVVGRSSSFQFKGKNEDLRTIGKKLGVATVLEGSVIRVGDRIKVTAQLISTADGSHIWSKRFDQGASNIFSVYDQIANGVVEAFKTSLQTPVSVQIPWNEEAYKLYQQGHYFHNRGMEGDGDKARDLFERSIKLDSTHAIVWTALASYYADVPDKERLHYINKAIALDSNLADAVLRRALFYLQHCEFKKADEDLKRAIRSNPSSPRALRNTGEICGQLGYYDLATEYTKKAVLVDPLQVYSYQAQARVYMATGNFSKAIEAYTEVSKLTDRDYWVHGMAVARALTDDSLDTKKFQKHFLSKHNADSSFYLFIMAQYTRPEKANVSFQRWLKADSADNFSMAEAYAFRRDKNEMFKFLERSVEKKEPSLYNLLTCPEFIPYRNDPKFVSLKKKLGYQSFE